jgi:hypothetical protein
MVLFVVPYFVIIYGNLQGTWMYISLAVTIIGVMVMFSYEIMSMNLDGMIVYLSSGWNYIDLITPLLYLSYCVIMYTEPSVDGKSDLATKLRLMGAGILTTIIIKLTWF